MIKMTRIAAKIASVDANAKAAEIIDRTLESNRDYFDKTMKQRTEATNAGSYFQGTPDAEFLKNAEWEFCHHPNVNAPAKCLKARLPGYLGAVDINDLPDETSVRYQAAHGGAIDMPGDPGNKAAECVSNAIKPKRVNETYMIYGGPEGGEVMWTIHPGEPSARPSPVSLRYIEQEIQDINTSTVAEAKDLGFKTVKYVKS